MENDIRNLLFALAIRREQHKKR